MFRTFLENDRFYKALFGAAALAWVGILGLNHYGKNRLAINSPIAVSSNAVPNATIQNTIEARLEPKNPTIEPNNLMPKTDTESITFEEHDIASLTAALFTNPKAVKKTLMEKWKLEYSNGKLVRDLEDAIERSRSEIAGIREIFRKEGVPLEYAFLPIPESHWTNAVSNAGAVGIFQILAETARSHGGIVTSSYDSRKNPFESAMLAAKILKYLNSEFHGNWDLTLAAYNSRMPWEYRKEALKKNETLSYETYLLFLAKRLEKLAEEHKNGKTGLKNLREKFIRENLNYPPKFYAVVEILMEKHKDYFNTKPSEHPFKVYEFVAKYREHKVQSGETLSILGRRYGIPFGAIKTFNNLPSDLIGIGETLLIPNLPTVDRFLKQHGLSAGVFSEYNPHINGRGSLLPPGARVYILKS